MATVAQLLARAGVEKAGLLVVEGLPYAWTTTTDTAIVGTSYLGGGRTVKSGLQVPKSFTVESFPEDGLPGDQAITFTIVDLDDHLVALFKSEQADGELERVGDWLHPGDSDDADDPAPANLSQWNGGGTVTLWDRHIGIEKIGSAGERREWWIDPITTAPGLDHPTTEVAGDDHSPVYVSDNPYTFKGRKAAFYTLVRDPDSGAWASWDDQANGGAMIWYGTMQDAGAIVRRSVWKLSFDGPASWLEKELNTTRPEEIAGVQLVPQVTWSTDPGNDETQIAVWFRRARPWVPFVDGYNGTFFADANNISAISTRGALVSHLADVIENAADGSGLGGTNYQTNQDFTDDAGNSVDVDASGDVSVSVAEHSAGQYATVNVCLHQKAAALWGFDPAQHNMEPGDPQRRVRSRDPGPQLFRTDTDYGDVFPLPGPGYRVYSFTTLPTVPIPEDLTEEDYDNGGIPKEHQPLWHSGAYMLDPNGQQIIQLTLEPVLVVRGQKQLRPSPESIAAGRDRAGYFVFEGKIRRGEGQEEDYVQVAFASWAVVSNEEIGFQGGDGPSIFVEHWEDPREFGFPYERMTAPWVYAGGITVRPAAVIGGYRPNAPEEAHRVLLQLLMSSGTGNYSGLALGTAGDNDPGSFEDEDYFAGDRALADLSLGIPSEYIDTDSFFHEAGRLPSGGDGPLGRCSLLVIGQINAKTVISSILRGRGWALKWGRKAGEALPKWGLYSPFEPIDVDDYQHILTDSNKASRDPVDPEGWLAKQSIRWAAPINRFEFITRWNPLEGSTVGKRSLRSLDRGRATRGGKKDFTVEDLTLSDPDMWPNGDRPAWAEWRPDVRERFQRIAAEWHEQRHFSLTWKIMWDEGRETGPGFVEVVTDGRPANAEGSYGLTLHPARVMRATYGLMEPSVEIECMVQAKGATLYKVWGPGAKILAIDLGASQVKVEANYFAANPAISGARGFEKRAWMVGSGNAKVLIRQSKDGGATFPTALDVTADCTDADETTHVLTLASITGTILRDTKKWIHLQAYGSQTAGGWVQNHISVVTLVTGTHSGGTQGTPLEP